MSYIVPRDIPQNCEECRFQSESGMYCDAMQYNFCGNTDDIERPDWCPLVKVPVPHGRMIDADKIIASMNDMNVRGRSFVTAVNYVKLIVGNADTVIEAEGSEE